MCHMLQPAITFGVIMRSIYGMLYVILWNNADQIWQSCIE